LCPLFFAVPVFAITLSGYQVEITTDPCAAPQTVTGEFDSANNLLAWIDSRDNTNYINRVYAANLNDPARTEYLIDPAATQASEIKTDGRYIAYIIWTESGQILRIADASQITHPVIKEITGNFIESFDLDNGIIVFRESADSDLAIPQTIYVVSLADASMTKHKIKEFFANDYVYTNIALDAGSIVWSGEYYDDANSVYSNYLDIANISNLANPVVARNFLPKNSEGRYTAWINLLAISDNWLIARGTYNDQECVFGLHNFKTPSNWSFTLIRQMQNYDIKPLIDSPYVVWAENNNQPGFAAETPASSFIVGAVLFDNGKASSSIIKSGTDPDWTITGATVSGDKVIWGADYNHSDGENYITSNALFTDSMQMQCGDKGYLPGDLNRDCKIDFADFADLARQWLDCTRPNDSSCIDGEIY
jgi:hypothetical protein